ncbi:MAG: hypothetical protein Q8Q00_06830 [Dehalococcoidia bacterium]|nr:hypothetical protein [Dehalococcoidia bacterium]
MVRTALGPYMRPGDIFLLISGNFRPIDIDWLNRSATRLKAQYPDALIVAGTTGLTNISALSEGGQSPIEAVVYIYEPNFPKEPEFTWDFGGTIANFDKAAEATHAHGLRLIGKPTGRPIMHPDLQRYGWDYAMLGRHADRMFIQTQTYCKKGADVFATALDKLVSQYQGFGAPGSWLPQVTIDPDAPNGVTVQQALRCSEAAQSRGLGGLLMWWSPKHADAAVEFLQRLGR